MRALVVCVLTVALSAPLMAQGRGRGGGFGGGGFRGGGGIGIGAGRVAPPRVVGGGFGVRGPGFRVGPAVGGGGWRSAGWGMRSRGWGGWGGWGGGWGWGGGVGFWPGGWGGVGFVSGFSAPAYYSDPWPAAYPVYSYPAVQAAPPVVIINQTPSYEPRYIERYVERRPAREPDEDDEPYRPITYEIAFKDGRELTALAYWVRESTLNYVTRDYEIRQTPVASVDRARSRELNRPNGISLRLPPER
jgi:hypothetical protein